MNSFLNRFRFWSTRERLDEELAREMRSHREMLEEQFLAEGLSRENARHEASRHFGNDLTLREQSRDEWGFMWMDSLLRDFRFAGRRVLHEPLLAAAAVLTVALGVGANTAIVSVLETVLLNPLGMRDAGRVMAATVRMDGLQMRKSSVSGVEFRELQSMDDAFSSVAATENRAWTSQMDGEPTRILGTGVTTDFFQVFGQAPAVGRFFFTEDRESVVLSYSLWQSRFQGSSSVIGRVLMLDGQPHRIVGVASAGFRFPATALAWTPLVLTPARLQQRGNNMNLALFVRLKNGVMPAQAIDRVNRYAASLKAGGEGRDLSKLGYYIELDPFAQYVAGDLQRPLWLLWVAALIVLFTGCANIAALLLSRTAGRKREMAIRLAVGATKWQIVRQLLVESVLLGALGGAAGIVVAEIALSFLTQLAIPGKQMLALVSLDQRLMLYGFGLSLVSGLLFGLAPAIQLLRESQTAAMARGAKRRFQDVFIAAEVAAALVLLISTGLLLRSLRAIERIRPGFDAEDVTTAYLIKPKNDPGFIERLDTNLRSTAGAQSAALAFPVPFSGGGLTSTFSIKGRQRQAGEPEWHGEAYFVSPGYFHTLRIPLLHGRPFSHSDGPQSPVVCVIDSKLAERFFRRQDPIGQEIAMYRGWARIVGVVAAIRGTTLEEESRPVVYYPLVQVPFFPQSAVLVRSPYQAASVIRQAVRHTNGSVALFDIRPMKDRIAESLGIRRVLASLVSIFAAICLLLAAVGLYGVAAQVVGERTPEIGIRLALGALPAQILTQFLRQGLLSGALGLLAGLVAASYSQRWLTGMLYDIQPFDPATFFTACLGVMSMLTLAVLWPARRASRIDPQTVLRYE